MTTVYDFTMRDISGKDVPLISFAGKVLLIVNVASKCGFTPQYRALERLQETYADRGFSVLAFPCNQFGGQEPGSESEIAAFCERTYGVTFPLFAKVNVNGPAAHPLFQWLKAQAPGFLGTRAIKWNFTKFLIDRSGRPVARHAPMTRPEVLAATIEQLLTNIA